MRLKLFSGKVPETPNQKLLDWAAQMAELCHPSKVHWCDGSREEYQDLCNLLVSNGTAIALDSELRPNSFLCRSDPQDAVWVHDQTFLCSLYQEDAGPTNNWIEPSAMKAHLTRLFKGCMHGRTMYVIPFCLGPLNSSRARFGVQVTDSPYIAAHAHILLRMGSTVLDALGESTFIPCVHSLGAPLRFGQSDVPWPCNPEQTVIAHFPDTREIWSYGNGHVDNGLLAKTCLGLRLASIMAHEEGWLAEHMAVFGATDPAGEKKYFAAALPDECGKTSLAMMAPTLPNWKVRCVGDEVAWLGWGEDKKLRAINPLSGFYSLAPGISRRTSPNIMAMVGADTIFTDVALTPEGDVWWEGLTPDTPAELTDWRGKAWTRYSDTTAAHPDAHFATPLRQCPTLDPVWEDPDGVPIDVILFGGCRASTVPVLTKSFNWAHGVWLASSLTFETEALHGDPNKIRHDPFAMSTYCGYHLGDYFAHWIKMGDPTQARRLPIIYSVNLYRAAPSGKYLWPGYNDNIRLIKWIFENLAGEDNMRETAIGYVPKMGSVDLQNLTTNPWEESLLSQVNGEDWRNESNLLADYFRQFESHLPVELEEEMETLEERLLAQYLPELIEENVFEPAQLHPAPAQRA